MTVTVSGAMRLHVAVALDHPGSAVDAAASDCRTGCYAPSQRDSYITVTG